MISSEINYQQTGSQLMFSLADKARSFVQFAQVDAPLLNQWHKLITCIREKANKRQWVTLINPPFIPNDEYLDRIGLGDHYVRVIRLSHQSRQTEKYIQRCLQNGKSSVVAIWANDQSELPDILLNESPLGCQALVFTKEFTSLDEPQFELAF